MSRKTVWGLVIAVVVTLISAIFGPIIVEWFKNRSGSQSASIYKVRVTVLDFQGSPVKEAAVQSSIGGEPKETLGGWEFDIPAANRPKDGWLTIFASKEIGGRPFSGSEK